ncbi:MAG TPA: CGNR zinc finger domain-containing protein [Streptosporangiaceae bacterium]|nr:CGNR zinc finger domain-containing protein [Streptosporangiaceae bacterium]
MPTRDTALRFDAGRYSLNLAATLGSRTSGRPVERIGTTARLAEWFSRSGLTVPSIPVASADLAVAHELRDAVWRLAHARLDRSAPGQAAVRCVNRVAAAAPLPPPELSINGAGALARVRPPAPDAPTALAVVARDAIDLLTGEQAAALHACAADGCSMIFVDESGRRRYCDPSRCGTRTRVAALRARRRAS